MSQPLLGGILDEDSKKAGYIDENVLDATIRELQGVAESANIGQVQTTVDLKENYRKSPEAQLLIEPESDKQELQDFQ